VVSGPDDGGSRPADLEDAGLAGAAPTLDGFERERTKASLREKMFGAKPDEVRIGRFLVIKRVGAGGMGVVYAAYDSELDRKVALKLIRPEVGAAEKAQQRLLREARALAKLSHSNVVQVYDVGTHDGQVWIAMEFVEGRDLAAWLDHDPPRTVDEIVPLFLAAGRGLAAAHEVGLVHRDFKPANVLVGDDGEVRVVDFGLARPVRAQEEASAPDGESGAPLEVSRAGARVGTPAYMSPEQHLGDEVDARTDQFSFCVALYEALYGERPFQGDSLIQLSLAVTSGELREPPRHRQVPEHLRRLLLRGLSQEPDDRYPTMEALLADLSFDPRVRRRRRWLAGGFVVALGAAVGGTYYARESQLETCTGAEQRLDGIWDPARKAVVEKALTDTGLPLAADTWTGVEAGLDAYADAWSAQHTEACRATQLGEQSQQMLDLRMRCLDRRLRELSALVEVLAEADEKVVQSASEAVARLPRLEQCADLEALAAEVKPPDDPKVAAAVEGVRSTLGRSRAREDAGKYEAAMEAAHDAVGVARTLDYPPVLAEALLREGELAFELGDFESAEETITQAYHTALEAKHDRAAADAASALVAVLVRRARFDDAMTWVRHAQAMVNRVGPGGAEEARLLESWGELLDRQAQYGQARDNFERALEIHIALDGPEHPAVAAGYHRLGRVAYEQGEYVLAGEYFQRSLDIGEQAFGPNHPALGRALTGLGTSLKRQHEYERARKEYERSLAITEAALGEDHPAVARDLNNLGNLLRRMGEFERARSTLERALEIREKTYDPEHPAVAQVLTGLGQIAEELQEYERARDLYARALKIREKRQGPAHADLAQSLDNLGISLRLLGDDQGAIELHRRAWEMRRELLPDDHLDVAWGLTQLADAELGAGETSAALEHANRALGVFRTDAQTYPEWLAQARFVRARALWALDRDHAEALKLAERARDAYAAEGAPFAPYRANVEAWLAERSE
jgi:tetratricopeptide (TPR) repeat protein/predicted Ser/Thr protein kinase